MSTVTRNPYNYNWRQVEEAVWADNRRRAIEDVVSSINYDALNGSISLEELPPSLKTESGSSDGQEIITVMEIPVAKPLIVQ